jgi:ribosome biogenesis GTPase
MTGLIVKGISGFYYVYNEHGYFTCKAKGVFRNRGFTPLPGDLADFNVFDGDKNEGNIYAIKERRNELIRPAIANVDFLIAVIAAKSPLPDLYLLDRMLASAHLKGIESIIVINKTDLDENRVCNSIEKAYTLAGYNVISHSLFADKGCCKDDIAKILKTKYKGKVGVLAGQSGVGKSTILNYIADRVVMNTGDLSKKTDHGKHTTRHAELIMIDGGGWIADTPGFSILETGEIEPGQLAYCYPEIWLNADNCRFTSCLHDSEPDCSVKEAVEKGIIDRTRYLRYIDLLTLLKKKKKEYGVK